MFDKIVSNIIVTIFIFIKEPIGLEVSTVISFCSA